MTFMFKLQPIAIAFVAGTRVAARQPAHQPILQPTFVTIGRITQYGPGTQAAPPPRHGLHAALENISKPPTLPRPPADLVAMRMASRLAASALPETANRAAPRPPKFTELAGLQGGRVLSLAKQLEKRLDLHTPATYKPPAFAKRREEAAKAEQPPAGPMFFKAPNVASLGGAVPPAPPLPWPSSAPAASIVEVIARDIRQTRQQGVNPSRRWPTLPGADPSAQARPGPRMITRDPNAPEIALPSPDAYMKLTKTGIKWA